MAYAAVASAERTATGNSGYIDADGVMLNVLVAVSAVSGSPTLDLSVEWSNDGGTTFAAADPADTFTQITTAVARAKRFAIKADGYRLVWTIGGTDPSLTFGISVLGTA